MIHTLFIFLTVIFISGFTELLPDPAAGDTIPEYSMNEIIVLGDPGSPFKKIAVFELDVKTIQERDNRNPQLVLEYAPGIYFSRNSRNEYSFRLRGFEQRQISVFLDGIPISIPFDGMMDISQLIGQDYSKMRLSKGVSSILYGANSLGGTIDILSLSPGSSVKWKAGFEGSTHRRFYGHLQYSHHFHKLKYLLSFTQEKSPDFKLPENFQAHPNEDGDTRQNSAYRKNSLNVRLQYDLNTAHQLGINLDFIDNWYNVPPQVFATNPRFWRFPEWKKNIVSINSLNILSPSILLQSVLFYDSYYNHLESYDDNQYNSQIQRYAFSSFYDDYSLGGIIYPQFKFIKQGTTNGILSFKQDVHRQKTNQQSYQTYSAQLMGIGLEQEIPLSSRFKVFAGIDANYFRPITVNGATSQESMLLLNGQGLLNLQVSEGMNIFFLIGKKSRFPTLKELYSDRLGRNIPNPDLQEEHAWNFELGAQWANQYNRLKFSIFYNRLHNLITEVQFPQNFMQLQNTAQAEFKGAEFEGMITIFQFNLQFNYTFLNAQNQSPERESNFLSYRPKHRMNIWLRWDITSSLQLQADATYTADQYYQNPASLDWEELNDFSQFNSTLYYFYKNQFTIYIRINNLIDQLYYSECGIPMPGREVTMGIKLQL
jgi:iron complex outermembrane receptor protein